MNEIEKIIEYLQLKMTGYTYSYENYDFDNFNLHSKRYCSYFVKVLDKMLDKCENDKYIKDKESFFKMVSREKDYANKAAGYNYFSVAVDMGHSESYTPDINDACADLCDIIELELPIYLGNIDEVYPYIESKLSELKYRYIEDAYSCILLALKHKSGFAESLSDEKRKQLDKWLEKLEKLMLYGRVFGWYMRVQQIDIVRFLNDDDYSKDTVTEGISYWKQYFKDLTDYEIEAEEEHEMNYRELIPSKKVGDKAFKMAEMIVSGKFCELFKTEVNHYYYISAITDNAEAMYRIRDCNADDETWAINYLGYVAKSGNKDAAKTAVRLMREFGNECLESSDPKNKEMGEAWLKKANEFGLRTVEYKKEYGAINYPDGFEKLLEGLSVEKQMNFFRVGNRLYLEKPFLERRISKYDKANRLDEDSNVEAVIVHNNKIVGIMVCEKEHYKTVSCMIDQEYCSYYETEIDGSGEKETIYYSCLFCVGEDFGV